MFVKYDHIGQGYNKTRQADPFLTQQMLLLLGPSQEGQYLDIGCGTGNYTLVFKAYGGHWTGIDPSEKMLTIARKRSSKIQWLTGQAEALPLAANSMNGVVGSLTIHHWQNLDQGFRELAKVIVPGGRLVLFTSTAEMMEGYWLRHYFPTMLQESIQQMPTWARIEQALQGAGFQSIQSIPYFVKSDLKDHFLYVGKDRPSLYLDDRIRKGISSFADLAREQEVARGLQQLKEDIDSGQFYQIRSKFENQLGDYLLVQAISTQG